MYEVSDEVVATVAKAVNASAEMYRQYDGFAAEIEVGPDATVLQKALAVSGRQA